MTGPMSITGLETGSDDDGGWNLENGGRVSIRLFSEALAGWLVLQGNDVPLAEAKATFNTTDFVIRQASTFRKSLDIRHDKLCFLLDRARAKEAMDDSFLARMIQVIAVGQNEEIAVGLLCTLTRLSRERIEAAVLEHPYMSIVCDEVIHDGD